MSEIKPIFDPEAIKQLADVNKYLDDIKMSVTKLQTSKVNIGSFKEAATETQKNKKAVDDLAKAEALLMKAQSDRGKEIVKVRTETTAINAETRKAAKLKLDEAKAVDVNASAYDRLSANYKVLQVQLKQIAAEQGTTSKAFKDAKVVFDQTRDSIIEIDQAAGDGSKTVGLYRQEFGKALQDNKLFGRELTNVTTIFNTFQSTTNNVTKNLQRYYTQMNIANGSTKAGTTALQKFRIAMIATGIGAFVAIVGGLAAAFLSTQRGVDALNRVLEPLKAILQSVWGLVQDLSMDIVDAFKNPKQAIIDLGKLIIDNILNRFKAVIGIAKALAKFDLKEAGNQLTQFATGIENAGERTAKFLGDAVKQGKEVEIIKKQIEKAEEAIALNTERRVTKENELQLIAKNTAKSIQERKKAVDDILALTQEQADEELNILNLKIALLKLQQSFNDTGREGNKELNELLAQQERIVNSVTEKKKEFQRVQSTIDNEAKQAAKERASEEKKRLERIRELASTELENLKFKFDKEKESLKLNKEASKLTEQELKALEKITLEYDKQVDLLTTKTQETIVKRVSGLLSEKKALEDNIKALQEYYKTASPEVQKAINEEMKFYTFQLDLVNTQLESMGGLLPTITTAQQQLTQVIREQSLEYAKIFDGLDDAYKNNQISAEEYYKALSDLDNEYARDTVETAIKTLEQQIASAQFGADEIEDIELQLFEYKKKLRALDLANFEKIEKDKIDAAKTAAERQTAIREAVFANISRIADFGFDVFKGAQEAELQEFKLAQSEKQEYLNELLENGAITQEEYLARKSRLEEESNRKEMAMKRKAAIADKAQALFSIGLNTAAAIMAQLKATPLPVGAPLVAIIAATGGIQAALVAAKPIPKFAKGVKGFGGGMAEIGEQGQELVRLPGGDTFLTPQRMITFLPKGTDIFSNKSSETQRAMNGEYTPYFKQLVKKKQSTQVNVIVQSPSNYSNYAIR